MHAVCICVNFLLSLSEPQFFLHVQPPKICTANSKPWQQQSSYSNHFDFMCFRLGDEAEAVRCYQDAHRMYPANMDVILWLGAFHVKNEVTLCCSHTQSLTVWSIRHSCRKSTHQMVTSCCQLISCCSECKPEAVTNVFCNGFCQSVVAPAHQHWIYFSRFWSAIEELPCIECAAVGNDSTVSNGHAWWC